MQAAETAPCVELKLWNPVGVLVLPPKFAVAIGVALLLLVSGIYLAVKDDLNDAEQQFGMAAFFLLFGAAALSFLWAGCREIAQRRRRQARRRDHESEPWLWDYKWDPVKAIDRSRNDWKKMLFAGAAMALLMVPFHLVAVRGDAPALPMWVLMLVVFDAAILAIAVSTAYHAARRVKYGRVQVRLARFPYFTGEQVDAVMDGGPWLQRATRITAKLRHVVERIEPRRSGKNKQRVIVAYSTYEDTVNYDTHALQHLDLFNLPIRFQIPADAASTWLGQQAPTYWDLEVLVEAPGVDYKGHFLLPIYRRAG
jgi:hypothetical protein